jgi:L-lysine 6-transaminase
MIIETITPAEKVHEVIGKSMLADGFKIVLDLKNSYRNKLVDEKTGETYIDFFTFFA